MSRIGYCEVAVARFSGPGMYFGIGGAFGVLSPKYLETACEYISKRPDAVPSLFATGSAKKLLNGGVIAGVVSN